MTLLLVSQCALIPVMIISRTSHNTEVELLANVLAAENSVGHLQVVRVRTHNCTTEKTVLALFTAVLYFVSTISSVSGSFNVRL